MLAIVIITAMRPGRNCCIFAMQPAAEPFRQENSVFASSPLGFSCQLQGLWRDDLSRVDLSGADFHAALYIPQQRPGNTNFPPHKSLVILFQLLGNITVVHGDPEGSLQAIRPQVAETVNSLDASAIGKMECGHRVVELSFLTRFGEIGQSNALQRGAQGAAMV